MGEFAINARGWGKQAPAAFAQAVGTRLREAAQTALESGMYGKADSDPGVVALRAAADYVQNLDRSHPNVFAISVGQKPDGSYVPTQGEVGVMSMIAGLGSSNGNRTVAPDVVIAELACAALEEQIAADRVAAREARDDAAKVRQELERVRKVADRVPVLIDEADALRNRIAEVESELAAQQKRTEFVAARWAAEQSVDKPKTLKKTTVAA